jgi:SAM-dependent methyltransferase
MTGGWMTAEGYSLGLITRHSREIEFLAAASLSIVWILLSGSKLSKSDVQNLKVTERPSISRLLLASFLTLFAELAFIRWITVEVRVFAYFKNLALLLCFVGFGLGCSLPGKATRWRTAITALLGLLVVIRLPFGNQALANLSQDLGTAADVELWTAGQSHDWIHLLLAILLAGILFLFLVWIFVPLGQVVSRQLKLAPRTLSAYSWNLLGSLLGVLLFLAASRLMLPPTVWLGLVIVGFAWLQDSPRDRWRTALLVIPLALFLHDPRTSDHYTIWTPYQQIEYSRFYDQQGGLVSGNVMVNHTGYQYITNLSDEFLIRHPRLLKEPVDENPYNAPFRFASPLPSVLIVGSGTGNDVAAALRHGSSMIDAVEIDPAILEIGKREHPEHPYDSPKVSIDLTDARAFLKRSARRYDLILFGLLDSHTQLSDYSNMRIDNFVYTKESFREAKEHLKPDGVLFVKFQVSHPWVASRLAEMLQQTFAKVPLIFRAESSYTVGATCFAISPSGRIEEALARDARLAQFVDRNPVEPYDSSVRVTTDDWPYLYQRERSIPRTYLCVSVLVILIASGLYLNLPRVRKQAPSLFFFCMGAGFLLLETQAVSRLALYFGTTWEVNGIVISALLVALLAANFVASALPETVPRSWIMAALIAGLLIAYGFPFSRIPGQPSAVGTIAALVFSVPVFLAGLLFSVEFRKAGSPGSALGANVLGAVLGGLLENISLLVGMRALLLLTVAVYLVAAIGLWRGKSTPLLVAETADVA